MRGKTLIIAEAGVNHNGDIKLAKQLIDVAANSGVDCVKFQTFKASKLVTESAGRAKYQNDNLRNNDTQFQMLKKLELSEEAHFVLNKYCQQKNIQFLSTGFDEDSLLFLKNLGITLAKIPSGEITNLPYLRLVAKLFPKVILSTGMANIEEIRDAVTVLIDNGLSRENLTILHCNTEYPTPMKDVNLCAMNHIKNEFGVDIGYSDHTLGIEVPIAAVTLGAKIIEKHFTLDRNLAGPDHKASLEPNELKQMVTSIRNIEKALSGSGFKEPSQSESKNKTIARKSIIASTNIQKGETFTNKNITIKRPGNGVSPMKWDEVIGETAKRNFITDELIEL